jgi:putative solute:sodium symporter small subunit
MLASAHRSLNGDCRFGKKTERKDGYGEVPPWAIDDSSSRSPAGDHAQEETHSMQSSNDEAHWSKTRKLMFTHLVIWFFFGYIIHMFVKPLNQIIIPVLNFPLGFYMAAQGSLIAFVVMLFIFARQQDRIDREHGVAEDD